MNFSQEEIANFSYVMDEKGKLCIDDVKLILKSDSTNIFIYYNTKHSDKVSNIFNVSIDNTMDDESYNINAIGTITLSETDSIYSQNSTSMTKQQLIENFIAQNEIDGIVYNILKKDMYNNNLIVEYENTPNRTFHFKDTTTIVLNNERAQGLFNALITSSQFTKLDSTVCINSIHTTQNKNCFLAKALNEKKDTMSFKYYIDINEYSWITK